MADDQNENPRPGSLPEPVVQPARVEERRRVAEIARELEELRPALEGRDHLDRFGAAETAKGSPTQPGPSDGAYMLMERGIEIARDACRKAAAEIHRLTGAPNSKNEAEAQEAIEEKTLARETEAITAEEKLAAVAAAGREEARQAAEEKARAQAACKVAETHARAAAQEAADRQAAEDARFKADEAVHRAAEAKLRKQADRAGAALAQERARSQELEQQLAAHADDQKLLVEQTTRIDELEQQLAAFTDDQKLLAQERARSQELEQQLAAAEATLDRVRTATVSVSDRPTSTRTALEAPDDREATHLMTQARVLIGQGNISAARRVLERAAGSGNALSLFLLAETYDRAILSAWGIFGRRGDVSKARHFYAKAVAAGVHEAKHRLTALS